MKPLLKSGLLIALTVAVAFPVLAAQAYYSVVQKISVPGDGGWDCLAVDPAARRLYVSHATQVEVLDMDQNRPVATIPDTPGVHAIAIAPALGRGFTSNGKDNTVTIFDLKTLKALERVPVGGENPDLILFDPQTERVFTFNGRSKDATAIDAATGKVLGHLALDGKPEFAVSDGKGSVYVNLEDKSMLLRFDPKTLTVQARWPLAPCEEPSALSIDPAGRRLFAGCGNQKMVVVDADTGRVITTLPIGTRVDGGAFDPALRRVFSSNGEGTLTVIQQDSPDAYRVLENTPTQIGARTVALDPQTHRLYLPVAQFGATPPATAEKPHPRPAILPGTFQLLVVAPTAAHESSNERKL